MVAGINPQIASFIGSLSAADFVGTWDHDVTADRVLFDAGAAAIMTGNQDYAGQLVPLDLAFHCLHDQDRQWVFPKLDAISQHGGVFIADYRVHTPKGIRRLFDHGTLSKQSDGTVRGYGILLDITNSSCEGHASASEVVAAHNRGLLHSLNGIQADVGQRSFRASILFDMLRTELARLGLGA